MRVRGERRLARAREPEEERGVALLADVRRAVHRQHVLLRHQVIHHREDRLLQLARVARAADEDHALGEAQHDEGARARAVALRIRLHLRRVQHREVGQEAGQIRRRRTQEHVPHELHVPRVRAHEAHGEPVRGIRARPEILDEEIAAAIQILLHIREQRVEVLRRDRPIDLPPPHILRDVRIVHDELVVRRAARVRRRDRDEGSHVREHPLVATHGLLDQLRRDEVPVHASAGTQSLLREAAIFRPARGRGGRGRRRFSCHLLRDP